MIQEASISQKSTATEPTVLSVIAPCLNEEGNVEVLVHRVLTTFDRMEVPAELLLVDDGSTDRTWELISRCALADRRVRGIRHSTNKGMEQGWRSGIEAARGELICLIDADLQNRPEDIATLYGAYCRERPDIVQAVRHPVLDMQGYRVFSRGLNLLLNLAFGTHSRDSKSGFVICRREVLLSILQHRFRYRYFQCFLGVAAGVRGFGVFEVDTVFEKRNAGTSFLAHLPIRVSVRAFLEIMKFRVECWTAKPAKNTNPPGQPADAPVLLETVGGKL